MCVYFINKSFEPVSQLLLSLGLFLLFGHPCDERSSTQPHHGFATRNLTIVVEIKQLPEDAHGGYLLQIDFFLPNTDSAHEVTSGDVQRVDAVTQPM